ncbi:MAG TPA: response regulator [Candidatus Paceibacterota bacterium]|nr:response regulator [Candidatus Paceibacterota bacterium]
MKKIIIADDVSENRAVLQAFFEGRGYETVLAESGERAIHELVAHPDTTALITDYRMPRMNGIEVVRLASSMDPKLFIVLASGDIRDFEEREAREAGAKEVLGKPYDLKRLKELFPPA